MIEVLSDVGLRLEKGDGDSFVLVVDEDQSFWLLELFQVYFLQTRCLHLNINVTI